MQIAHQFLVLLHLVGFAALLGGVLVQLRLREPEVNTAMLYGAVIEVLTGVGLFVWAELSPGAPHAQLIVKTLIALVVVVLVAANRKYASIPRGLLALIGGLTVAAAGVSVLWDQGQ
jgi:hypothetical protein